MRRAAPVLLVCALACVGDEAQVRQEPQPECPEGRTACGGLCVDTQSDVAHCGGCDSACAAGEVCDAGSCAVGCADGKTVCASACVDTSADPNHCGDCDAPCVGQLCSGGACRPAADCQELHEGNTTLPDGIYDLDPEGDGESFAAYCDMTIEGGGWTLVASVADRSHFAGTTCSTACDVNAATTCDPTPFESAEPAGDVNALFAADHKSHAYATVPFEEFLFVDSNGQYASYAASGTSVVEWYPAGLQNHVAPDVEEHASFSYPVQATNMQAADNACGTLRVAFNVADSDSLPTQTCHSLHNGPGWSNVNNNACYWDDAGIAWTSGAFYAGNSTTYRLWLVR